MLYLPIYAMLQTVHAWMTGMFPHRLRWDRFGTSHNRVPPSHTTRHRGPYHGGSIWLNAMMSAETDQPHSIKELVVERHPHTRRVTDSPRTFRTERRGMSQLRINPTLD